MIYNILCYIVIFLGSIALLCLGLGVFLLLAVFGSEIVARMWRRIFWREKL